MQMNLNNVKGDGIMTTEDLNTLMETRQVIIQLASSLGMDIEELNESYGYFYGKLCEIIYRWENNQ